ncbi:MAG: ECF transporter S component, partial [Oscillospiraceae bacterium]|nr:ECF transporter S component [Oscillospiraceae bacterium]
VSVLQGMTVSAGSGVIGIIMHVTATGCFAILAGSIYKKFHTRKAAYVALGLGVLVQTAIMALMNLWLTPIYMGTPTDVVLGMMIPVIIPFNLIKAGVNAFVTALVYKKIHKFLMRINLA